MWNWFKNKILGKSIEETKHTYELKYHSVLTLYLYEGDTYNQKRIILKQEIDKEDNIIDPWDDFINWFNNTERYSSESYFFNRISINYCIPISEIRMFSIHKLIDRIIIN